MERLSIIVDFFCTFLCNFFTYFGGVSAHVLPHKPVAVSVDNNTPIVVESSCHFCCMYLQTSSFQFFCWSGIPKPHSYGLRKPYSYAYTADIKITVEHNICISSCGTAVS